MCANILSFFVLARKIKVIRPTKTAVSAEEDEELDSVGQNVRVSV